MERRHYPLTTLDDNFAEHVQNNNFSLVIGNASSNNYPKSAINKLQDIVYHFP